MSMQHDSHARFYQFRQADIFDKPEQNIRDGHGPQIQRGHATAVGPAPAPVQEESVADSVDGYELINKDALDQSESSVVLGGYAGSSRQRN